MKHKSYPVIDPVATGRNIKRLRIERGLTVKDLQTYFGFEEPRAIYKWQSGESLPSVDNLYALSSLFEVHMDQILVRAAYSPIIPNNSSIVKEQQFEYCCSDSLKTGRSGHGSTSKIPQPFLPAISFIWPPRPDRLESYLNDGQTDYYNFISAS